MNRKGTKIQKRVDCYLSYMESYFHEAFETEKYREHLLKASVPNIVYDLFVPNRSIAHRRAHFKSDAVSTLRNFVVGTDRSQEMYNFFPLYYFRITFYDQMDERTKSLLHKTEKDIFDSIYPMALSILKKYLPSYYERGVDTDFRNAVYVALIKALYFYNTMKNGLLFTSYCYWWVKQSALSLIHKTAEQNTITLEKANVSVAPEEDLSVPLDKFTDREIKVLFLLTSYEGFLSCLLERSKNK